MAKTKHNDLILYERKGRGTTRHGVRLSTRLNSTELIILLTEDIAKQIDLTIGGNARLHCNEHKLVIAAAEDGNLRVRRQDKRSGGSYPYLVVPIGKDKSIDCKLDDQIFVQHEIEDGELILPMPAGAITVNKRAAE